MDVLKTGGLAVDGRQRRVQSEAEWLAQHGPQRWRSLRAIRRKVDCVPHDSMGHKIDLIPYCCVAHKHVHENSSSTCVYAAQHKKHDIMM